MQLTVKGKQIDVGDALRNHVATNLTAIVTKYFDKPIEANVVVSRDAHRFKVDISVHVGRNILLKAADEDDEAYHAFDKAADKIAKRLRRYKRRLRDHHSEHAGSRADAALASIQASQYILEAEPEDSHDDAHDSPTPATPLVVAEMTTEIDTLSVSEAVMRMDLGEQSVVMFRNRTHGELNVVYRRPDGNIGWIDPRGNAGTGG